ncbi:MAG: polysaccharide deacetylase family protein [Clostridiales bacterium]|nr:polysaccharide deacetylase family protein [Clostridiales bacterium]
MFNGKMKALTFSFDDGVVQDERLIALFDKYHVKGTFNLNSGNLGRVGTLTQEGVTFPQIRFTESEIARVYRGHEVAAHTLTHRPLVGAPEEVIVEQVEADRLRLSDIVGYEVRGFAYPGPGVEADSRVAQIIRENTGVRYARTANCSGNFEMQDNLFEFRPTVYEHGDFERMVALGEQFIALKPECPQIFYIFGHSYEFDIKDTWDDFERFLANISGRDDIFYGTNAEVLLAAEGDL